MTILALYFALISVGISNTSSPDVLDPNSEAVISRKAYSRAETAAVKADSDAEFYTLSRLTDMDIPGLHLLLHLRLSGNVPPDQVPWPSTPL